MKLWQDFKAEVNLRIFKFGGKRPWTRGYAEYRQREIQKVLRRGNGCAEDLPKGYGFRLDERIVEYPWVLGRLPHQEGRLLDAGSVLNHESLLRQEKICSKQVFISTLAPERVSFNGLGVSYVYEDLRESCFRDGYFDWVVSLSTIEHIGMDNTLLYTSDGSKRESNRDAYLEAIKEFRRILKPNGVLYVSVPYGKPIDHGWFQVFDARMIDQLILAFSPSSVEQFYFRYFPEGWRCSSREDAREATYFDIHSSKIYDPDYAAASRAIVCLELRA